MFCQSRSSFLRRSISSIADIGKDAGSEDAGSEDVDDNNMFNVLAARIRN